MPARPPGTDNRTMTEDPTAFGDSRDPGGGPPAGPPPEPPSGPPPGSTPGSEPGSAPGPTAGAAPASPPGPGGDSDPGAAASDSGTAAGDSGTSAGPGGPAGDAVPPVSPGGGAPRRLERAGEGRLVTGVCAGIGRYTRIDPVVIRVGFAVLVLATFGVGVLLYVAAFLFMAEEGGTAIIENVVRRRFDGDTVLTLLGGLLCVGVLMSVAGSGLAPDVLVVASMFALVLLVAHARGVDLLAAVRAMPDRLLRGAGQPRGHPAGPHPQPPEGGTKPESDPAPWPPAHAPAGSADPAASTRPPASAPAGGPPAAPHTQPLPATHTQPLTRPMTGSPSGSPTASPAREPAAAAGYGYPPPHQMVDLARLQEARVGSPAGAGRSGGPGRAGADPGRRRRSAFTPLTLFAVLMTVAVMVPVAAPHPPAQAAQIVLAGGLAVVALALVGGSWFGQGRGLVAVGTVLSLGLLTTSVATELPARGGRVGDAEWYPVETAEIAPTYRVLAGNGRLDLTGLRLSAGQRVTVSAEVTMGEFRVVVPRTARVEVHANAGMGDITVDERLNGGIRVAVDRVLPPEGGTTPQTPVFVLHLRAGMGNLEVQRDLGTRPPEPERRPEPERHPEAPRPPEGPRG
jgi:phage shock protein PspC (stress-responsive transcriptional regulator)